MQYGEANVDAVVYRFTPNCGGGIVTTCENIVLPGWPQTMSPHGGMVCGHCGCGPPRFDNANKLLSLVGFDRKAAAPQVDS